MSNRRQGSRPSRYNNSGRWLSASRALGRVFLRRAGHSSADAVSHAERAASYLWQAHAIDPTDEQASIDLACALALGGPGGLAEADRVLRQALNIAEQDEQRWRLCLALAQVLIRQGDLEERADRYREAHVLAIAARGLAWNEAEPHYVIGVVELKLHEREARPLRPRRRSRARQAFQACLERDGKHVAAQHAFQAIEERSSQSGPALVGSVLICVIAAVLLGVIWTGAFLGLPAINTTVLISLTPVLMALFAVGVLIPFVTSVHLPGGRCCVRRPVGRGRLDR